MRCSSILMAMRNTRRYASRLLTRGANDTVHVGNSPGSVQLLVRPYVPFAQPLQRTECGSHGSAMPGQYVFSRGGTLVLSVSPQATSFPLFQEGIWSRTSFYSLTRYPGRSR